MSELGIFYPNVPSEVKYTEYSGTIKNPFGTKENLIEIINYGGQNQQTEITFEIMEQRVVCFLVLVDKEVGENYTHYDVWYSVCTPFGNSIASILVETQYRSETDEFVVDFHKALLSSYANSEWATNGVDIDVDTPVTVKRWEWGDSNE